MKEINRTKIKRNILRKTNPELIKTISLVLKSPAWTQLAKPLSGSNRNLPNINLEDVEEKASVGDIIIFPGKILSLGEITKKIRICALGISKLAKEKLKKTKSEYSSLLQEIKNNPKAQGIKIIK